MMTYDEENQEIALTYVRYYTGTELGPENPDHQIIEALQDLAREDPLRMWDIILQINAVPVADKNWQKILHALIGCGELETIIALHPDVVLPKILATAATDATVRAELSTIYESSLDPDVWAEIQTVVQLK